MNLIHLLGHTKYVYLIGHFFARTSALSDITTINDEILRQIMVNLESVFLSDSINMMSGLKNLSE